MTSSTLTTPPATQPSDGAATSSHYAVRVGVHGQVGRFQSSDEKFARGARVVCRTARGLEVGVVLSRLTQSGIASGTTDGSILRRLTEADQLLWANLQQIASAAHAECQIWLAQSRSPDILLDVEPLLDGRTLFFHFLTATSSATDEQIARLVSIFQETVAASPFARLLDEGCGPTCGTADSGRGCGTAGGCQSCHVAKSCGAKRQR